MSTLDKVRVVVVGDSESGKTSLSHLIAHGNACERPMSTIGCSTQVKLHDYRAGRVMEFSVSYQQFWTVFFPLLLWNCFIIACVTVWCNHTVL